MPHTSRLLAAGAAVLGLAGIAPGAAVPADAQQPLTLDDVGAGTCTPTPVHPQSTTDCAFELRRSGSLDPAGGPYQLLVETPGGGQDAARCHVAEAQLRCPDLSVFHPGPSGDPTQSATLAFGDRRRQEAVTVELADPTPVVRLRIADTAVVTPTVPLRYATIGMDRVDGAWLRITPRYEDEVVATIEVEDTSGWDAQPASVDADALGVPAGSYRLRLCLGEDEADCRPTGRSTALQLIDQPLAPLWDDGHADPTADRINLVVAGHGFDSHAAFVELARTVLDPDGGLVFSDEDGQLLTRDEARRAAGTDARVDVTFGPFAIEPLASHADRFNLWVLPRQLDDPWSLHHTGEGDAPPWIEGLGVDGHELANVSVATLAQDPPGLDPGSRAAVNDLHEVAGPVERGDDGEVGFSGATTWVDDTTPWRDAPTVAHELGHTLFGLRDEYRDPSSSFPHYGRPNCAESREQAERWWGDHLGEVDPMAERYREVVETYQPDLRDIGDELLAEWVGIGIHEHPCGASADAPASFVPTRRGLMAHELPVFGTVNRERAEQVLGLFTGRPAPTPISTSDPPAPGPDGTTGTSPTPGAGTTAATPGSAAGDEALPWTVVALGLAGLVAVAGGAWAWWANRR